MSIRILTDSACDFTKEEGEALGITIIPLTVTFGDESFKDCIELTHDEFFEKLIETSELPSTSQITPYQYEQYFSEAVANGDQIICITLSSRLSGCYQSAMVAAEEFGDSIRVIDSLNACVGQRLIIERALQLIDEGLSFDEVCNAIEQEKKNIRLIALLDTLEYLKKGGRISSAVAAAGTLLSIKPVIAIVDGSVELLGKARGSKNGNNKLNEFIELNGPIDFDKPCAVVYSGLSTSMLDKYLADSLPLYTGHESCFSRSSIGCAIGTHIGPGAIGAAFFCKTE